jgi:hypothetical protein
MTTKHTYVELWRVPASSAWDYKAHELVLEIEIDTVAIAAKMAAAAVRNKSKTAREVSGAVTVRVLSDTQV